ncbi:hypothetical protein H2200_005007 [Cladophialophora chaetospira]|uniref:Uncharacterized protein n=1 Tax=Cladophialophora chaetospira TaxID=386627 RepID=A0AA39CJ80_9EURO|nr:hypothetical protein H2200_005007 [Cladophialophora chaetospira]
MPGVLWTTASIQRKDLPVALMDAWYGEHIGICLSCPGNGGLFLRYRNTSPATDPYVTPKFNDQAEQGANSQAFVPTTWPFLALIKLDDTKWLSSPQFDAMPRTSVILPPEADGSIGSAFTCLNGCLRSYETVGSLPDPSGRSTRPKYILSVQSSGANTGNSDRQYAAQPGFRGSTRYRLVKGLLGFEEPGLLPESLALHEFDGDKPPQAIPDDNAFKVDVWELILEAGDTSLRLWSGPDRVPSEHKL